ACRACGSRCASWRRGSRTVPSRAAPTSGKRREAARAASQRRAKSERWPPPLQGLDGGILGSTRSLSRPELETERLRLRQFRNGDLDAYARLTGDAETMRYL